MVKLLIQKERINKWHKTEVSHINNLERVKGSMHKDLPNDCLWMLHYIPQFCHHQTNVKNNTICISTTNCHYKLTWISTLANSTCQRLHIYILYTNGTHKSDYIS